MNRRNLLALALASPVAFPDTPIVLNHCGHAMAMDLDAPAREQVFREYCRLIEVHRPVGFG